MIKVGQTKKARYWGKYEVKDVVQLKKPIVCRSKEIGAALFQPTIVRIKWEVPPSSDKHEFWFPYWISIEGKEKYGQFAPMIGENALLELFEGAIDRGFFSKSFLKRLNKKINGVLT